jgi:hypothetical protein
VPERTTGGEKGRQLGRQSGHQAGGCPVGLAHPLGAVSCRGLRCLFSAEFSDWEFCVVANRKMAGALKEMLVHVARSLQPACAARTPKLQLRFWERQGSGQSARRDEVSLWWHSPHRDGGSSKRARAGFVMAEGGAQPERQSSQEGVDGQDDPARATPLPGNWVGSRAALVQAFECAARGTRWPTGRTASWSCARA